MRRRTLLGMLPAAVALTACGHRSDADSTRIRFATDWQAQAEHGGFYQALATGEYAKRGLKVEIIPGGPGVSVPQLIASGAIEMGMGSDGFVVLNLANEKAPVKAVAAFFQKNPQVIIAHDDPAIKTLADLKGHPILISSAARDSFWPWLKAKYGFTDDQIRSYNNSDAPFLADPRAAQEGYLTSEPYTIEKATHVAPKVFLLADDGYASLRGHGAGVGRSAEAQEPDMVSAFVEASAVGWKSYLHGDPAPANKLILRANPEMTQDLIEQARQKMSAYGIVDGGDAATQGIGVMTDARWADFFEATTQQGLFPKSLDYRSAYTLQFLPRVKV